ncbi:hypothetical protein HHK36_023256 [Tetracentron sinense]|uniref:NAD(P)-binding domain-containing protein n=1 Tax=Tetracentron sinense TaxID=13715 RepID=A0A834YQ36_TETSI|nr:hypothetical protein HHK36_023256 [Tetracentron sinense]
MTVKKLKFKVKHLIDEPAPVVPEALPEPPSTAVSDVVPVSADDTSFDAVLKSALVVPSVISFDHVLDNSLTTILDLVTENSLLIKHLTVNNTESFAHAPAYILILVTHGHLSETCIETCDSSPRLDMLIPVTHGHLSSSCIEPCDSWSSHSDMLISVTRDHLSETCIEPYDSWSPRSDMLIPVTLGHLSETCMDYADSKRKSNFVGKILLAATITALCIIMLKQSLCFRSPSSFSRHELGVTHVLVTGGAGYIGSHAVLRLLKDSHRVTIVDNLSRGNLGAIEVLQEKFPEPGRLQFIYADLGDAKAVNKIFAENAFDAVIHFAAVAYVGESTLDPLRYYHNITSNTLVVLEAMAAHDVKTLIYSSTCATYGEPEKMPITEETPQAPINPYGKAKKMAEDIILDFSRNTNMAVMILRYFNVIGSDPDGKLGEAPRPELREHGRISGACFDAALGIIPGLKVKGTDYKTADGTCVRDYIDVTDLVDAHVKALSKAKPGKVGIYNVGTGTGRSVKEFVEACKKATGVDIKIEYLSRRPGDYAEVYSDPSKIRRELNWTAQHTDLQKSLQTAWRWQKSHKNGYGSL